MIPGSQNNSITVLVILCKNQFHGPHARGNIKNKNKNENKNLWPLVYIVFSTPTWHHNHLNDMGSSFTITYIGKLYNIDWKMNSVCEDNMLLFENNFFSTLIFNQKFSKKYFFSQFFIIFPYFVTILSSQISLFKLYTLHISQVCMAHM